MSTTTLRLLVGFASTLVGVLIILVLNILPMPADFAKCLVDKTGEVINYFAIQNFTWIAFTIGMGEIILRYLNVCAEQKFLNKKILPTDPTVLLRAKDLAPLYKQLHSISDEHFFPRIAKRIILQFQTTQRIDQSHSLLNSSLDLMLHELDLRYQYLRYLVWLIPSLGFIGTVMGLAMALNTAGNMDLADPQLLKMISLDLAVAFYTTFLSLILSSILLFFIHAVQAQEEMALNRSGQHCLDHLINKLLEEPSK